MQQHWSCPQFRELFDDLMRQLDEDPDADPALPEVYLIPIVNEQPTTEAD